VLGLDSGVGEHQRHVVVIAAAKRFKATGSGKFLRRRAFRNHLLDHKSPKRKRYLGTMAVVDDRDHDNVSLMLPYA